MSENRAQWINVPEGALISDRGHDPERVGPWLFASDAMPGHWYRMVDGRRTLINPEAYVTVLNEA